MDMAALRRQMRQGRVKKKGSGGEKEGEEKARKELAKEEEQEEQKRVFDQGAQGGGIAYHLLPADRYIPGKEGEAADLSNFKFPEPTTTQTRSHTSRQQNGSSAQDEAQQAASTCDRQPVLFLAQTSKHPRMEADLPDTFYELTREEAKRMVPDTPAQERPLTSAMARQRKQQAKRPPPSGVVVVRLTFSDRTVIQARFLPSEPVCSAYALLEKYVKPEHCGQLDLFTTPPRKSYPRSSHLTFQDVSAGSCLVVRIGKRAGGSIAGRDVLRGEALALVKPQAEVAEAVETQVRGVRRPPVDEQRCNEADDSTAQPAKKATKPRRTAAERQARLEAMMLKHIGK